MFIGQCIYEGNRFLLHSKCTGALYSVQGVTQRYFVIPLTDPSAHYERNCYASTAEIVCHECGSRITLKEYDNLIEAWGRLRDSCEKEYLSQEIFASYRRRMDEKLDAYEIERRHDFIRMAEINNYKNALDSLRERIKELESRIPRE